MAYTERGDPLAGRPAPRSSRLRPLDRNQRFDVVRALEGHGLFQIKGSVDELAKRLGVSRFTVHGYVEAVRKADKATGT